MRENRVVPIDTIEENPAVESQLNMEAPPLPPFPIRLHKWLSDNVPYYQLFFVSVSNTTQQDLKNAMIWFLNSASIDLTISVSNVIPQNSDLPSNINITFVVSGMT